MRTESSLQRVGEAVVVLTCQILEVLNKALTSGMGRCQDLLTAVSALTGALLDALHHVASLLVAVGGLVITVCEFVVNLAYVVGKEAVWLLMQGWECLAIVLKFVSHTLLLTLQWSGRGVHRLWVASGAPSSLPSLTQRVITSCVHTGRTVRDSASDFLGFCVTCVLHVADAIVTSLNHYVGLACDYASKFLGLCVTCCLHALTLLRHVGECACGAAWELVAWTWDWVTLEHGVILLVTFLGVFVSVLFVQQLHGRGFPLFLPGPANRVMLPGNPAADFVDSDVEENDAEIDADLGQGEESDEETSGEDEGWDDDEEDGDEEIRGDDEMTVAGSDTDNSENEENDQNAINVHLPEPGRRRARNNTPHRELLEEQSGAEELRKRLVRERDGHRCVVCLDHPKSVLLLPCKHVCLCVECAHQISQWRPAYRRVCPLCRERMETVMYVHL